MTLLAAIATSAFVVLVVPAIVGAARRHKIPGPGRNRWGLDVTPAQFWIGSIAVGIAVCALVLVLTGVLAVAVVPGLIVAMLPRAYYAKRRSKRVARIQEAWPDGLRDLIASVKSGASLHSSLEELGRYGPLPLREVFASFSIYSRSLGVVPTLEMIRADLSDPTSDRVIEVLIIAHERGGSVVPEILSDIAEATTKDVWAMEQIRSEALEQKINSRIVFVLPWIVLVVMTMRAGAFRDFYATPTGTLVIVGCGVLSLIGMAIASRIGAQPEEPRVFVGAKQ